MESGEKAHRKLDHLHGARNDHAAAFETSEPVTLATVVLLDLIGEVFADVMLAY